MYIGCKGILWGKLDSVVVSFGRGILSGFGFGTGIEVTPANRYASQ
jgi:hypothetical protein